MTAPERIIYHYLKPEYFLSILKSKCFSLSSILRLKKNKYDWREGTMFSENSNWTTKCDTFDLENLFSCLFISCWTSSKDDNRFIEEHFGDADYIRIESTEKKFREFMKNVLSYIKGINKNNIIHYEDISLFVKDIDYIPFPELDETRSSMRKKCEFIDSTGCSHIEAFTKKEAVFSWEKEIRFIYSHPETSDGISGKESLCIKMEDIDFKNTFQSIFYTNNNNEIVGEIKRLMNEIHPDIPCDEIKRSQPLRQASE